MGLSNTTTTILAECAKIESANIVRESMTDNKKEDFYHQLLKLEEVDESSISYDEETVKVMQEKGTERFLIEFEDLSRYMLDNGVTAKTAISKICEHYDISEAMTHVVIESMDNILNQITEGQICQESGNSLIKKYGKDKVELTYAQFNEMSQAGVKLLIRPSSNDTVKIY